MSQKLKGFTLIELLVVIAIIGILATVVIGSVNTARSRGQAASAVSSLSSVRANAEIFFDNGLTYNQLCTQSSILELTKAAQRALGVTETLTIPTNGITTSSTPGTLHCSSDAASYAVAARLPGANNDENIIFCVDSTGTAKRGKVPVSSNAKVCP